MRGSRYGLSCPDCGSKCAVRDSEGLALTIRSAYLQCKNVACGSTFRGMWTLTHRMNQPLNPNPEVSIPLATSAINREVKRAQGDLQMDIDDVLDGEV